MSRPSMTSWFDTHFDWGKLGRFLVMAGTLAWAGINGWSNLRAELQALHADIHALSVAVQTAQRETQSSALSAQQEGDLKIQALEQRVASLESRQNNNDHRSVETSADIAALKEQSAATLRAVTQLQQLILRIQPSQGQ